MGYNGVIIMNLSLIGVYENAYAYATSVWQLAVTTTGIHIFFGSLKSWPPKKSNALQLACPNYTQSFDYHQ